MADQAVSTLDVAPALTGSEIVMVTSGGNSDRTTTAAIAALAGSGSGSGTSASSPPFLTRQDSFYAPAAAASSYTVTFNKSATVGNTLLVFVANDFRDSVTTPSGFTNILAKTSAPYSQINVYRKIAAGGETSFTIAAGSTNGPLCIFMMEIVGSHALDQSATSTGQTNSNVSFPSITPAEGSMIFVFGSLTQSPVGVPQLPTQSYTSLSFTSTSFRGVLLGIYRGQGAGTATGTQGGLYGGTPYSDTPALGTFSIL